MTDTGQVPSEGLPESAGTVEQPGVSAPGAYAYLSETTAEDEDLLLLPGAQSAWGNEVAPPAPEPVVEAVHEPGPHEMSGRDSGSVDLSAVRLPNPTPPSAPVQPRRPLHLGPPIPDTSASPVRSLADRGPAGAPVRHPGPPTIGPEYLDVPPQGAAPWGAQAVAQTQVSAGATPAETVVPAAEPTVGAAQAVVTRVATEAVAATASQPAEEAAAAFAAPEVAEDGVTADVAEAGAAVAPTVEGDAGAESVPEARTAEAAVAEAAAVAASGQAAGDAADDALAAGPVVEAAGEATGGADAGAEVVAEGAVPGPDVVAEAVVPGGPVAEGAGEVTEGAVPEVGPVADGGAVTGRTEAPDAAVAEGGQSLGEAPAVAAHVPAGAPVAETATTTDAVHREAAPAPEAERSPEPAHASADDARNAVAESGHAGAGVDGAEGVVAEAPHVGGGAIAPENAPAPEAAVPEPPQAVDQGMTDTAPAAEAVPQQTAEAAETAPPAAESAAEQTAPETGPVPEATAAVPEGAAPEPPAPAAATPDAEPTTPGVPAPVPDAPVPDAAAPDAAAPDATAPGVPVPDVTAPSAATPAPESTAPAEATHAPEPITPDSTVSTADQSAPGAATPAPDATVLAEASPAPEPTTPDSTVPAADQSAPGAATPAPDATVLAEASPAPEPTTPDSTVSTADQSAPGAATPAPDATAPAEASPAPEPTNLAAATPVTEATDPGVAAAAEEAVPAAATPATGPTAPTPEPVPFPAAAGTADPPHPVDEFAPPAAAASAEAAPQRADAAQPSAAPDLNQGPLHMPVSATAPTTEADPHLARSPQPEQVAHPEQDAQPTEAAAGDVQQPSAHPAEPTPVTASGPDENTPVLPGAIPASPEQSGPLGQFVPVDGSVPTTPHLAPTPPHPLPPEGHAAMVPAPRGADPEPDPDVVQNAEDLDTRAADQEESKAAVEETRESTGPAAPAYDEAEREAVLKVMRERRDIRNGFRSDPIPHEVLLRVLEAAHTAPSVGHSQPWDFVVIRSAETRRTMHELAMRQREAYAKSLPKGRAKQFKELKIEAILDTPVNIVVTADPTRGGRHTLGRHTQPQMAPYSSALAVENLWLAARAEGLGVGWVSFFDEREMVRALGLPEHLEVVAYLCVGYVDEFPDEPELLQAGWSKRRPLSWVVHEETYGRRALPGEEPHDLLAETVAQIRPLDAKALGEAWERQKRMTKPAGALGMLEIISAQLSGLSRQCPPPIPEPAAVAIFAGDHGVHAQGVTPWPQEVTAQMVANFLGGGAVCNAFATQVGAEVCVVDVGVAADLPATPGLLPRKVRAGTSDMTTGPAMTREEAKQAIEVGIETARDLVAAGNKALLTGEMGIANTTASAALISVFTGADPAEVTGRGTGINDETLARKTEVVRRALDVHQPDPADPIGVLAAIGGFEHAAMVGLLLGGASLRTPVILDGVSAGAAALVARAIAPEVLAACIAGHRSAEPGHVAALNKLGLRPLVDLDLRLGEGTGALLALPLVQSTARAMHEVATFDSAGVTEK
ncbi:nicotinate-nucleotide--dimethylbenzimidazole phosphoribosyltransferase [Streptomyces sp. NPDC048751]|uniref:nicotinate-nucleotide--dimethylbenzimidazole phosphoribosyltransferase n=1 Tax=Streptomyces sp. NPDC048751 TaxID=3365591 RepID=UPI00371F8FB0